jgi:hypothetical protein
MVVTPFAGLRPAIATDHARWAVQAMSGRTGVAQVVPDRFDAYLRMMHRLDGGSWSEVAASYLRRGEDDYPYPFPDAITSAEGDLGADVVDTLIPHLAAATSTAKECHFGLWNGWGEFNRGAHSILLSHRRRRTLVGAGWDRVQRWRELKTAERRERPMYAFLEACAVQPWWGGRDTLLFDGPIEAVAAIGSPAPGHDELHRHGPQWWWPDDRAWFVGNERSITPGATSPDPQPSSTPSPTTKKSRSSPLMSTTAGNSTTRPTWVTTRDARHQVSG